MCHNRDSACVLVNVFVDSAMRVRYMHRLRLDHIVDSYWLSSMSRGEDFSRMSISIGIMQHTPHGKRMIIAWVVIYGQCDGSVTRYRPEIVLRLDRPVCGVTSARKEIKEAE